MEKWPQNYIVFVVELLSCGLSLLDGGRMTAFLGKEQRNRSTLRNRGIYCSKQEILIYGNLPEEERLR